MNQREIGMVIGVVTFLAGGLCGFAFAVVTYL